MSKFTTLRLESERPARDSVFDDAERAGEGSAGSHLRYAFVALLAVNIFLIFGALCFAFLYVYRQ